jgi:tetratricopeptide (TPR) repeat protein
VGVFLNRLGDYENALKRAREAIDLNPDYPHAHFVAGCAMQGLENHQGAIPEYQKAINYWEALINLGNAYLELDRGEEALRPLQLAVELRPDCLEAHDFLGVAYFKTSDALKAEAQLTLFEDSRFLF